MLQFFFFFSNLVLAAAVYFSGNVRHHMQANAHTGPYTLELADPPICTAEIACRFSPLSTRRCLQLESYHIDDWTHFNSLGKWRQHTCRQRFQCRAPCASISLCCSFGDDRKSTELIMTIYWQVKCAHSNEYKKMIFFFSSFYWIRRRRNDFRFLLIESATNEFHFAFNGIIN